MRSLFSLTQRRRGREESDGTVKILQAMPSVGFPAERYANAYAFLTNHRGAENIEDEESESDRMVEILQAIVFLTNHRGAEDTESEKSDAFGGLRLRTMEILQALFLTNHRGAEDTESEKNDRTVRFSRRSAFLTNRQDTKESDLR